MVDDPDNPEWTDAEIARARPGAEVLPADFVRALTRGRGGQAEPSRSNKERVTVRLDRDVLDRLRAQGPGWQARLNAAVRKAVGL